MFEDATFGYFDIGYADNREAEVSIAGHIGSGSGNTTDAKVACTYLEYDCGILVAITTTLHSTRALLGAY